MQAKEIGKTKSRMRNLSDWKETLPSRKPNAKYLYCMSLYLALIVEHVNVHNHRCLSIPPHFSRAGCSAVTAHISLWPPRCNQPLRLEVSPDHLSRLTGHVTLTTTPTSFCAYVSIYTQGGCRRWRGYFWHYIRFSQRTYDWRFTALNSALHCPAARYGMYSTA